MGIPGPMSGGLVTVVALIRNGYIDVYLAFIMQNGCQIKL